MKSSTPPKIATWLFNLLGPPNVELAGDLIEEYKNGRSVAWYWRQVMIAIAVGLRAEVSSHKFLAGKAVATSWTILYLWHLAPGLQPNSPLVRFFIVNGYSIPELFKWIAPLEIFMISIASGWIVGWANRSLHRTAVLILFISFVLSLGYLDLSYLSMLVVDSIDQPRFRPYLGQFVFRFLVTIAGMLLGGILSAPTRVVRVRAD